MFRTRSGLQFGRMNTVVSTAESVSCIVRDDEFSDQGADENDADGPDPDPGLDSVHDEQRDPPQAGVNDILRAMLLAQEQRDRNARASEDRFFQLLSAMAPRRDVPPVHTVPEPKLRPLGKDDDIEAFLTTFERAMANARITEEFWSAHLAPQLTGKAQLAYVALSQEDDRDCWTTRMALLKRYNIDTECYRVRFRTAKPSFSSESAMDFCTRLHDLAEQWLREATDRKAVVDAVILEQLLSSLPSEVQVHVRQGRPSTANAAAESADAFLRARRDTPPTVLSD